MQTLCSAVQLSHLLICKALESAKVIVDATAGNGSDTLFLAKYAPKDSLIYAFDIQQAALDETGLKLEQAGFGRTRAVLIHDSHEKIDEYISSKIDLAMFNLGYLPGGDHALTTHTESTIAALKKVLEKLSVNGHIALAVYPGHAEGRREAAAVKSFAEALSKKYYTAGWYEMVNHGTNAPALCWIEKVGEDFEICKTRED